MMSAFSSFTVGLFAAMIILVSVDAAKPPLTFAERCRISKAFAQLFGKHCDPYLVAQEDCQVGEWGAWVESKDSQGVCKQTRARKIISFPRNGGTPCPSLQETKIVQCHNEGNANQLLNILKSGLGGFGSISPGGGLVSRGPGGPIGGLDGNTKLNNTPVGLEGQAGIQRRAVDCPADRDIVLIVDSSGSVSQSEFASALNDLSELIPLLCGFQPGLITQCKAYRLAMITYASTASLTFDLDDNLSRHTNQVNVQNDIKTKPVYLNGATATGDALKLAWDRVLQTAHGMRPNSKKTILLFTDGHYNHGTHNPITVAAEMYKEFEEQLSIVAFGIGSNMNYQELIDITNHYNPANPLVFFTESFYSFHDIVEEIKSLLTNEQAICSADVLLKKR